MLAPQGLRKPARGLRKLAQAQCRLAQGRRTWERTERDKYVSSSMLGLCQSERVRGFTGNYVQVKISVLTRCLS